eukprot:6477754-Amphidinium_carterae.3
MLRDTHTSRTRETGGALRGERRETNCRSSHSSSNSSAPHPSNTRQQQKQRRHRRCSRNRSWIRYKARNKQIVQPTKGNSRGCHLEEPAVKVENCWSQSSRSRKKRCVCCKPPELQTNLLRRLPNLQRACVKLYAKWSRLRNDSKPYSWASRGANTNWTSYTNSSVAHRGLWMGWRQRWRVRLWLCETALDRSDKSCRRQCPGLWNKCRTWPRVCKSLERRKEALSQILRPCKHRRIPPPVHYPVRTFRQSSELWRLWLAGTPHAHRLFKRFAASPKTNWSHQLCHVRCRWELERLAHWRAHGSPSIKPELACIPHRRPKEPQRKLQTHPWIKTISTHQFGHHHLRVPECAVENEPEIPYKEEDVQTVSQGSPDRALLMWWSQSRRVG